MRREVVITGDGSKTIRLLDLDENYHSCHGALQEAQHVFMKHGFDAQKDLVKLRIFEMGFGTGMNACLSILSAIACDKELDYVGIEAFPISDEEIKTLDYENLFGEKKQDLYRQLHDLEWNCKHQLNESISFTKIQEKVENFTIEEANFNIVFYDAFGPRVQQDLWEVSILKKMYDLLIPGGFLVTYCAKGQVKRNLKAVGFEIEALPGPPGKREMTRAWKR